MDVGGGRVVVSKDIHTSFPPTSAATPVVPQLVIRTGTLKAEGSAASEDDIGRGKEGPKSEFTARTDSADNLFMEDVSSRLLVPVMVESCNSDPFRFVIDNISYIPTFS
jgi:hypothetical protein